MHITSLPGRHGSGDLGDESFRFARFLAAAGQRWWQMLPVGPPDGQGFSPYSAFSAFAGSPWLVSLQRLGTQGLLNGDELTPPRAFREDKLDYRRVIHFRESRLRLAFSRFRTDEEFDQFRGANADWLEDYALYSALKRANRGAVWSKWPKVGRSRKPEALREAARELADEIQFHRFVQFQFDRQWSALRQYCNERGIGLIGDVPIFVGYDSCDVWANPELFQLLPDGRPRTLSGCPPDAFNPDGQMWCHPHYDWPAHECSGFAWWVSRFRAILRQFDAVRIDHFLGMHRLWEIPGRAKSARIGKYRLTPGKALLETVRRELGEVPIIAEDLGAQTPEAEALLNHFKYPGMRVMQFAFGDGAYHRPHVYPRRCVAYSGTHDNDTTMGWFRKAGRAEQRRAMDYLSATRSSIHWQMIRGLMMSPADTIIVPVQDVLGLGSGARMNTPGTARGNWDWRMRPRSLTAGMGRRLRAMCELYGRK